MSVNLRPEAQDDLVSAAAYFNDKNAGWGDRFLSSIELDLTNLEEEAGIHAIHNGLLCKFAKAFPFAIYYQIENGSTVVMGILSCRMNPGSHLSILKRRG